MAQLPAALTGFNALSPQQQKAHRAKIGVRAQAILGQFWQDAGTHDAVKAIEIEGWADVLENCSHSEIRDAWRDYQCDPANRTVRGRLAKPDAGALRSIILRKRPKPALVGPNEKVEPEEVRVPATAEQRAAIIAEFGMTRERLGAMTPQKMGAHKTPKGPSEDEVRPFTEEVAEQTLPEAERATAVEEAIQMSKAGCV